MVNCMSKNISLINNNYFKNTNSQIRINDSNTSLSQEVCRFMNKNLS